VNDLQDKIAPKRTRSILVVLSDLQPITNILHFKSLKTF